MHKKIIQMQGSQQLQRRQHNSPKESEPCLLLATATLPRRHRCLQVELLVTPEQ